MKEIKILQWINKFSGETGYVKSVSKSKGCFINTLNKEEAKKYATDKQVEKDLNILDEVGESKNNTFVVTIV